MSPPSLAAWRKKFKENDFCPWPGPRPLDSGDIHLLCGRDDTIKDFLTDVGSHRVIFLHGYSGVGKTSLLRRGLVPELKAREYVVAVCRDWSGAADAKNVVEFLEDRVSVALEGTVPGLNEDAPVMRTLAQEYGEKAIIVLDQFEELIRDAKGFTKKLFVALSSLVSYSKIKVIISLRTEELHELRQLEHLLPPFAQTYAYLDEIEDRYIPEVIDAGNVRAHSMLDRDAITQKCAELVRSWWDRAHDADHLEKQLAPGLLALQGLLYSLDAISGNRPVDVADVKALQSGCGLGDLTPESASADDAAQLFSFALSMAAEIKLDRCRATSKTLDLDSYLIEGAMGVLANAVPHMTSAGYKVVRNLWELCGLALKDEQESLRRGAAASRKDRDDDEDGRLSESQERAMFDVILKSVLEGEDAEKPQEHDESDEREQDLLTATRSKLASLADCRGEDAAMPWADRFHDSQLPFDADPEEVTSGPMMGRAPILVLMEEYRRFAFAMEWLRASDLVRFNLPMSGVVTVALIHDGFGVALKRWAEDQRTKPAAALHALTAAGGAYEWRSNSGPFRNEFDGNVGDGPRLIVNLRWRGSSFVGIGFRGVQFVNCDLRGALFKKCRFDGVSFVNCLLDGLMISECAIAGHASKRPDRRPEGASKYLIANSSNLARQMEGYRPHVDESTAILSDLPGFAAIPTRTDEVVETVPAEPGSVVILGGRTASLSIRNAQFEPGASFCVRDSAGSGLDVIEHTAEATYEISGCVLRHVTFTTHPDTAEEAKPIYINAWGSALYQGWIGNDLTGGFVASDCTLLHIWNGSLAENFSATADEGTVYHDLVGVIPDGTCTPLIEGEAIRSVKELDDPTEGRLVSMGRLMDYRRSREVELAAGPDGSTSQAQI